MTMRSGSSATVLLPCSVCLWLVSAGGTVRAQQVVSTAERIRVLAGDVELASQRLEAERPSVISGSIVMNTVRQFPTRRDLDGYLADRAEESRAWEAKVAAGGAQRTRVINPYTGSTYTKYYDDKGDWQYSVIEKDYRATEKLQEDWSREFRRARATLDELQREYAGLVADSGLQTATQSELAAMLQSATERMGEFGSPPPELLPRPVEGDANSPFPSFRAYDAITGKIIEIGPPLGEPRRPVADGGSTGPPVGGDPRPVSVPGGGPPTIVGRWSSGSNVWEFSANGTFQIVGSRSRGTWQQTARGVAIRYDGARVSISLAFEGDVLVNDDGLIGGVRLQRTAR